MIDVEVMVQRAKADTSITVEDADLTNTVEQQMQRLRDNFKTEGEFAAALKGGACNSRNTSAGSPIRPGAARCRSALSPR
jgi:hypothetical protein